MSPKKNGKTTAKTTAPEVGELVPQKHGGALRHGGTNKGNRNATGREPEHSHIRTHCRGSFAERVPILEAIADGEPLPFTRIAGDDILTGEISASIKERVSAIETLGKYGGVDKLALTIDEQPEQEMTPERVAELWERVKRIASIEQFEAMLVKAAQKQIGGGE